MKTSELIGTALDWAVAKCEGRVNDAMPASSDYIKDFMFCPSSDWSQGGPIIEREMISVGPHQVEGKVVGFCALGLKTDWFYGPTPLIAAMRCYVASKLGDEVNIPAELED